MFFECPDNLIIYGTNNSLAHNYAKKNGVVFAKSRNAKDSYTKTLFPIIDSNLPVNVATQIDGVNFTVNNEVTFFIEKEFLAFIKPVLTEEGRTLVPLRELFEKIEAQVFWNGENQEITIKKQPNEIKLNINKRYATIDNNQVELSVAPRIINQTTYVPLRFVSETFGYNVEWDSNLKQVYIGEKPSNKTAKAIAYRRSYFKDNPYEIIFAGKEMMFRSKVSHQNKINIVATIQSGKGKVINTDTEFEVQPDSKGEFTISINDYDEDILIEGFYFVDIYAKYSEENTDKTFFNVREEFEYINGYFIKAKSPYYNENMKIYYENYFNDVEQYLNINTDESVSNKALEIANKYESVESKVLAIHDFIAENVYYDWDTYESGFIPYKDSNQVMLSQKAVCAGYSRLLRIC